MAETETKSKRDLYRERVNTRRQEKGQEAINWDDEDAVADYGNSMMDEYEQAEQTLGNFSSSIDKSPDFAEMIMAAKETDNFNPFVWLVQKYGADGVREYLDDPEMAETFAKASQKHQEAMAKSKAIQDEFAENLPKSQEAIMAEAENMGMDEAAVNEVMIKVWDCAENALHGNVSVETFKLFANGAKYDNDVQQAREEGKVEGLNTKVDNKLRDISERREMPMGGQQGAPAMQPEQTRRRASVFDEARSARA